MAAFSYTAFDTRGRVQHGAIDVATQLQALERLKGMGLFPTKILRQPPPGQDSTTQPPVAGGQVGGLAETIRNDPGCIGKS
jgi:type II secretory pathway component PulF